MDTFPAEVLDRIFIQLHLEQKIECMLVCRKWAQVIRTLDLLHTVILPSSDFYSNAGLCRFNSLVAAIQENPSAGMQVERLTLDRCLNEKFDTTSLPTLFPRLRFLCLNQARMRSALDLRNGNLFESWQQHLETVIDISSTLFVPCMLTTGLFSRLTSISLFQYYGSHFLELNLIIDGLKNAPALNKLKLGHFYYYFHHFDMIHQAAPLLKSLSVSGVLLNDESLFQLFNINDINNSNNDNFLSQVQQNHQLETLCIEGDAYLLEQFVWIKYLSQKYTRLLHFTFNCNIPSYQQEEEDRRAHHELYFEFITPLFERLGSRLKTFQFSNHRLTPDLYCLFDDNHFRLENLQLNIGSSRSLIHNLISSSQVRCLKQLSLYLDLDINALKPLKSLNALKRLELKFRLNEEKRNNLNKKMPMPLNTFLQTHSPQYLESLTLENASLFIETVNMINKPCFLKSLELITCKLEKCIFEYISQDCKKLCSLSLLHCLPERLSIDLRHHDFLYVNIETKERGILKIVTDQNTSVYKKSCHQLAFISHLEDCFGKHDWPVYATRKKDNDTYKSLIDIHLTCKSIHTLFINKRLAL